MSDILGTAFSVGNGLSSGSESNTDLLISAFRRTKQPQIDALNKRKTDFVETVFDVYRHVPTRSYAMQGHRVAVFLGDDEQWYILDPIDGEKTTAPQLFENYLAHDVDNAEWLVRLPGYSFMNPLESDSLMSILPFFSDDVRQLF